MEKRALLRVIFQPLTSLAFMHSDRPGQQPGSASLHSWARHALLGECRPGRQITPSPSKQQSAFRTDNRLFENPLEAGIPVPPVGGERIWEWGDFSPIKTSITQSSFPTTGISQECKAVQAKGVNNRPFRVRQRL